MRLTPKSLSPMIYLWDIMSFPLSEDPRISYTELLHNLLSRVKLRDSIAVFICGKGFRFGISNIGVGVKNVLYIFSADACDAGSETVRFEFPTIDELVNCIALYTH